MIFLVLNMIGLSLHLFFFCLLNQLCLTVPGSLLSVLRFRFKIKSNLDFGNIFIDEYLWHFFSLLIYLCLLILEVVQIFAEQHLLALLILLIVFLLH